MLTALLGGGAPAGPLMQMALFTQGRGGYKNYRIPSLLTTQAGTLLAFCKGREGKIWPVSKLFHDGPSAYSCLAVLPDCDFGCLYDGGENEIW